MSRLTIIPPALLIFFFFSFGKSKPGVYNLRYIEGKLAYVPTGTFSKGENVAEKVRVDSFYIFNQEISNGFYRYYVNQVKSKGDLEMYHKVLPDTTVWRQKDSFMEPLVEMYFRHPAYDKYPVVGVSYAQSLMFCEWLTGLYNILPGRQFKKIKFDLPTQEEWEWAAYGGHPNNPFPWEGTELRDAKGNWRANFTPVDQGSVAKAEIEVTNAQGNPEKKTLLVASRSPYAGLASELNQNTTALTASSALFQPNGYGLYNMSGNVEEMVKENGISKGGSWKDTGHYLLIATHETYSVEQPVSAERGFRICMKTVK